MGKMPILLTPAHARSWAATFGNLQRGVCSHWVSWANPVCDCLGPVIFFLSVPATLSEVSAESCTGSAPPSYPSADAAFQGERGTYNHWNPQNTDWVPCIKQGRMFSSLSCYICRTATKRLVWGTYLSYKCHNIESSGRPTLLVSQTCITWPKPLWFQHSLELGPLLWWCLGLQLSLL